MVCLHSILFLFKMPLLIWKLVVLFSPGKLLEVEEPFNEDGEFEEEELEEELDEDEVSFVFFYHQ